MSATAERAECPCLERGPRHPDIIRERDLGRDDTEGRFADVDVIRCARCRQLWLRYQYEIEAFTASGRWYEAVIDEAAAAAMTTEDAYGFIKAAPWRIVGGSFYGHSARRVTNTTKSTS
jgi:hypothetical protein